MTVAGLDIGGSKIETRVFDANWQEITRTRSATPDSYPALIDAITAQIHAAEAETGPFDAIGVGSAGLINPQTGLALTANLCATGQAFPADLEQALQRPVTFVNDCRALTLSEAVFGAGRGHRTVMGLILGTGIGGGIAVDGKLLPGPTATGGEYGHFAAPAHLVRAYDLPLNRCGCGRMGCIETYVAGPGLQRLALHLTGQSLTPPEISARRDGDMAEVWQIWSQFAAELLHTLTLVADPDVIVLAGGLSRAPRLLDDLRAAAAAAQLPGFGSAPLALAEGGDASGARGAAYAAWTEACDA